MKWFSRQHSCNDEVLPKTPFVRTKKVFESFLDKKKYHREFEANKLKRAAEVKEYLEKSIKCKCGRAARIMVPDPYDIESKTWLDEPEKVVVLNHYSCKDRKCIARLKNDLENSAMEI